MSAESPSAALAQLGAGKARWTTRLVARAIPSLARGRLILTLPNEEAIEAVGAAPGAEARMNLRSWRALARMYRRGEHGFADAYVAGEWTTPDLAETLAFFFQNEAAFAPRAPGGWLTIARNRLRHALRANTPARSPRNIEAHYDLGNAFYAQWLDAGMNYSSALRTRAGMSLEEAQAAKNERIRDLLRLKAGARALEIGCGWGALAQTLLRGGDCAVDGVTLSPEQLRYAQARLQQEIAQGRARLALQDYRDLGGAYDRIVSIEMIEAVGERYWATYFARLRHCLKPGGLVVLQAITIDAARYDLYRQRPDFIQRYIFPGGMLPTKDILRREAERAGLRFVDAQDFGDDYCWTLREWRARFLQAWPRIAAPGFDARFKRIWEMYLAYCETGFREKAIDVSLYRFAG